MINLVGISNSTYKCTASKHYLLVNYIEKPYDCFLDT